MKKFIRTLIIFLVLMVTPVYADDFETDMHNYTISNMDKIPEEYQDDFYETMKLLPDYFINNYLKNGGKIEFVGYQLYNDDYVRGLYTYDKSRNYHLIQIRYNPKLYYEKDTSITGGIIANTLKHEIGHYYGINYTEKMSEESQKEVQKTANYEMRYNPVTCYNPEEAFAVEFSTMYGEVGKDCWGTNYSVPYDELEHIVKAEMNIEDNDCRLRNGVTYVY